MDRLLFWLSAKGEGSWAQFRAAVEEFDVQQRSMGFARDALERSTSDLPIYQHVRFALQRLAHVEFSTRDEGNRWRVVPPSMALLPGTPTRGLLCGARSSDLLANISQLEGVEVHEPVSSEMPRRILIRSPSHVALVATALKLGIALQETAPLAILAATPRATDPSRWRVTTMPESAGWSVHRFSTSRLQWEEVERSTPTEASRGLFRFALRHQRFYYLRWNARCYLVPVQVAKYALLSHRRRVLRYDRAQGILSVPVPCRPPLLVERALILCSGVLPRIGDNGQIDYEEVPPDVASLAAQLLGQEM